MRHMGLVQRFSTTDLEIRIEQEINELNENL